MLGSGVLADEVVADDCAGLVLGATVAVISETAASMSVAGFPSARLTGATASFESAGATAEGVSKTGATGAAASEAGLTVAALSADGFPATGISTAGEVAEISGAGVNTIGAAIGSEAGTRLAVAVSLS